MPFPGTPAPEAWSTWQQNHGSQQQMTHATPYSESPATDRGWDGEKHFSPYSSQYNSPVSALDGTMAGRDWYQGSNMGMGAPPPMPETHEIEMDRIHNGWEEDVATRGFTTTPIIRAPMPTKEKMGYGPDVGQAI
jgi:hypothetical protein